MPSRWSTFNKRRNSNASKGSVKAERKSSRKEAREQEGAIDEMEGLRRNAEEQAASFQVGADHHKRS